MLWCNNRGINVPFNWNDYTSHTGGRSKARHDSSAQILECRYRYDKDTFRWAFDSVDFMRLLTMWSIYIYTLPKGLHLHHLHLFRWCITNISPSSYQSAGHRTKQIYFLLIRRRVVVRTPLCRFHGVLGPAVVSYWVDLGTHGNVDGYSWTSNVSGQE